MLMTYRERQHERLLRRVEELQSWRSAAEITINQWQLETLAGGEYLMELGDFWPVVETPVHLHSDIAIPAEWQGLPVEMELSLGGEGFLQLSTGLQAGLNPMHHRFPVTESAEGGDAISIDVDAVPKGLFGSHIPEPRLSRAKLTVPHREVRALERDLVMLLEACRQLGDHEVVDFLYEAAEASLSELATTWPTDTPTAVSRYVLGYDDGIGSDTGVVPNDWRPEAIDASRPTQPIWNLPPAPAPLGPLPAAAQQSLLDARETLAARLKAIAEDYPPVGRLCLTGHAHIDLAWLWPVEETRRKTRRTFSTVINLMNRYDDFAFNQSSAQAYAWIEQDDPALFREIKKRVADGRWEPIGGMWVESDANIPNGEAFSRQLLYGQRYFEQTFGKRNRTVWLPDVFGYSANLPQIMTSAGIDNFYTIKLNWSEANRFPYDLFHWEGIDGSSVLSSIVLNPGRGYNGNIVPLDTLGTWREYRQKTRHNETILAFGWGDGAGGPSDRMLENYQRIKDFPALPRLRMGSIEDFFASISGDSLPRWTGELYLELHRGTYTSQARTKQLNRQGEHRLLEAEAFSAIRALAGCEYPREALETNWKTLLLNQFHDILPGSSIAEVYIDSHREMNSVVDQVSEIRNAALASAGGGSGSRNYVIANAGIRRPETAGRATRTGWPLTGHWRSGCSGSSPGC